MDCLGSKICFRFQGIRFPTFRQRLEGTSKRKYFGKLFGDIRFNIPVVAKSISIAHCFGLFVCNRPAMRPTTGLRFANVTSRVTPDCQAGNLAGGEVSLTRNLASKETFETNFGAKELKQRKNSFGKNKIVNSRTHEKKLFEQTKITIRNYI